MDKNIQNHSALIFLYTLYATDVFFLKMFISPTSTLLSMKINSALSVFITVVLHFISLYIWK